MKILLTYDVETHEKTGQKRLRQVAKVCKDYGQRVQNSVFECTVTEVQLIELKNRLKRIIDFDSDSIRVYRLPAHSNKIVELIGKETSYDVNAPLII